MLIRVLVIVAFIATLAGAIVTASASLAKVRLHQRAVAATRSIFADEIAAATTAIAATRGASTPSSPQPLATCAYADANGCELDAVGTMALASPEPAASTCPQTACTIYVQGNSAVNEARVAFHLSVTVQAHGGAIVATRDGDVRFRTLTAPPYATLAGSLDATLDALENGGTGDDGGSNANQAATLINVDYAPAGGGPSVSGNAWQTQSESTTMQTPNWSP